MVRAAYLATEMITWFVIVPLAFASLLTGLIIALGTPWGLFRHYWVLISLALTVLCTVVLLGHMLSMSTTAGTGGDLEHPGVGLIILLVIATLNVYKPQGMTPYGWRK